MISNLFLNFTNLCVIVSFLTKLLTLGILLSKTVRTVVVAKLVILGILPLASFTVALTVVLMTQLVMPGILSSIFQLCLLVYLNQQKQALIHQ